MIRKLNQLFDLVKKHKKKHLIVSCANEKHTIKAVSKAVEKGLIKATLIGNKDIINEICKNEKIDINTFCIVHEPVLVDALYKSINLVNEKSGDILMKGLVSSDSYLHAILNKKSGLLSPKAILTHIAVFEHPYYHKLLFCSDAAIIPKPDLKQKIILTNYVIEMAHKLGIKKPKIALISATEKVIISMEDNTNCAIITKMAERGQLKNAFVDGPLAIDVALDKKIAKIKKLVSSVAGDADGIIFPNIEAGNVFYKTSTILGNAEFAGVVIGANIPCVFASRGDSTLTKLYSIALGALMAT